MSVIRNCLDGEAIVVVGLETVMFLILLPLPLARLLGVVICEKDVALCLSLITALSSSLTTPSGVRETSGLTLLSMFLPLSVSLPIPLIKSGAIWCSCSCVSHADLSWRLLEIDVVLFLVFPMGLMAVGENFRLGVHGILPALPTESLLFCTSNISDFIVFIIEACRDRGIGSS